MSNLYLAYHQEYIFMLLGCWPHAEPPEQKTIGLLLSMAPVLEPG